MSNMYALKEETLTALGDAVRKQTGEYAYSTEPGEPLSTFSLDTEQTEPVIDTSVSRAWFYKVFNLQELLGVLYDEATKLYLTWDFETNKSSMWEYYSAFCDDDLDFSSRYSLLSNATSGSAKVALDINKAKKNFAIRLGTNHNVVKLNYFKIINMKIYAYTSNNQFIQLNQYTPTEMAEAINELSTVPTEAFTLTGDCSYRFAYNSWNWFIDKYGDKLNTLDINDAQYMFSGSDKLERIPFEINISSTSAKADYLFYMTFNNCQKLKELPKVNYTPTKHTKFQNTFSNCYMLREIPECFIDILEADANLPGNNSYFSLFQSLFSNCYSLRELPERLMLSLRNGNGGTYGNYYSVAYSSPFSGCCSLNELVNIHCDLSDFTSNNFNGYFFNGLNRVKNITFNTQEDGTPYTRNWKNQTLDLTLSVGYSIGSAGCINYNSGITADKEVKDDATYQALKNDPDWFTQKIDYSRYNHDSAVNTINSLPDCFAYGTNTIKFKGASGALTDGGAINTLTEEEIAVATAKGWTVTLS